MKRTLRLLLTVGVSLVCVSLFAQKFPNYPIPQQPDTLRILGIGNSFTDDGMMYLPELLEAAGIRNVVLGRLYIAGCSLERHCREYAGNAPAYIYYKSASNRWETVSKKATLLDGITDERWDVVVLQQSSGKSGIYPTYQPWFGRLVEIVRWNCPNAGACIAWQQTWAYARNSQHRDFGRYEKNQQLMYRGIVSSVEQLMRETSVEVVVPSGTAIQDLRSTALCAHALPQLDIAVSTGVHDGAAAVKSLLCGAAAVQVCTAIHRYGYEVIGEMNRFIDAWASRQGFESLDEFRGRMDYGSSEGDFYQRVQYMKYFPHDAE